MSSLWSGRFAGEPDKDVFEFGKSLAVDKRLFREDVEGSQAWAQALGRAGVLSAKDVEAIVSGLDAIAAEVSRQPELIATAPDEDVHSFVERELVARIGDAGKRLHTGRSRNEQVSLDLRLYLRRHVADAEGVLVELLSKLLSQAERAGQAVSTW